MFWYLLRNRRHVGPFSIEQLEEMKAAGKLQRTDFALAQEHLAKGHVDYVPVSDLLFFPIEPVEVKVQPAAGVLHKHVHESHPGEAIQGGPADYEPPLGSFSDEDILNNEVSRVFTQLVDSVDLAKGTHAGAHPSQNRKSTGKTHIGLDPSRPLPPPVFKGGSMDSEVSVWAQYKSLLFSPLGFVGAGVLVVAIGLFFFARSGALDKGLLKNVTGSASQVGAASQNQAPVAATPAAPNAPKSQGIVPLPAQEPSNGTRQGPIRLPASVERPEERPRPEVVMEPPPPEEATDDRKPAGEESTNGQQASGEAPDHTPGAAVDTNNPERAPDSVDSNQNGENNEKPVAPDNVPQE